MPNNAIQAKNTLLPVTQPPANSLALEHNVQPQNTKELPRTKSTDHDLRSASDTGNRLSQVTPQTSEKLTPESLIEKLDNILDNDEDKDNLQPLISLIRQQSFAFKIELVNHVFDNKVSIKDEILQALQLGNSHEDSRLRQLILQHYVKSPPNYNADSRIFDLAPDQRDLDLLIKIVQKLSISDPGDAFNLLFALNQKLPDQESRSIPNPNARVMPLPKNTSIELLKDILRNRLQYQNKRNSYVDIDTAKLVTLSKDVFKFFERDPFVKALKNEFEHKGFFKNEDNIELFTYIAILTHGSKTTSHENSVLLQLCIRLVKLDKFSGLDAIDYVILQTKEPKKMSFILEHLELFHNKLLGLALVYLFENNSSLLKFTALKLNNSKTISKQYNTKTINNIYLFVFSNLIEHSDKNKMALFWIEKSLKQTEFDTAMHDMFTTFQGFYSIIADSFIISQAYTAWLPTTKNKHEIKKLLHPDNFLMIEIIKKLATHKIKKNLPTIDNFEEEIVKLQQNNINFPSIKFSFTDKISIARAYIEPELNNWSADHLYEISAYITQNIFSNGEFQFLLEIDDIAEKLPLLKKVFETSKRENNENDTVWSNIAACLCLCLDEKVISSKTFNDALHQIASFRGDYSRSALTLSLIRYFEKNKNLNTHFFDDSLPKSSKIFQIPLALLSETGKYKSELAFLYHLIKLPEFIDTKKAMPLASFLSNFALYNSISAQQKIYILRIITSVGTKHLTTLQNLEKQKSGLAQERTELLKLKSKYPKDKTPSKINIDTAKNKLQLKNVEQQLQTTNSHLKHYLVHEFPNNTSMILNIIGELSKLASQDSTLANEVAKLMHLKQEEDLEKIMLFFIKTVFQLKPQELPEFLRKYKEYIKNSRNPSALLMYAASQFGSTIFKKDKPAILQSINLLAKNAIINDHEFFQQNRYSTSNNENNRMLKSLAPESWKIWQKPFVYRNVIEYTESDLKAKLDIANFLKTRFVKYTHTIQTELPILHQVLDSKKTVNEGLLLIKESSSKFAEIEKLLMEAILNQGDSVKRNTILQRLPLEFPLQNLASDIQDLKKKSVINNMTLAKANKLKVSISDRFEDLFLSGTEISNSCQSVYSMVKTNRALPANVLDGKYQIGVIHNENSNIMLRRMLRLMWSDTHKKQVIFVEVKYNNLGVPTKTDQVLIDLIREKAKQMNALVATKDKELVKKADSNTSITLISWPTSLPFENVDALENDYYLGNIVDASKGLIIENAFLI